MKNYCTSRSLRLLRQYPSWLRGARQRAHGVWPTGLSNSDPSLRYDSPYYRVGHAARVQHPKRDHPRPAPPLGSGPVANAALPAAIVRRPQEAGEPSWSIPPPKGWPPRGAAGRIDHLHRRLRATCPAYIRHHPHRSNPWKTSRGWGARRRCWPGASPPRGGRVGERSGCVVPAVGAAAPREPPVHVL